MIYTILDLESDGLLEAEGDSSEATVIHCLCAITYDTSKVAPSDIQIITDYQEMREFVQKDETGGWALG